MTASDVAVRGLSPNGNTRILASITTELVNELQHRHGTWPVATAALGRTATIGSMMGLLLKGEERLTLQVKGDGPLGGIVVDADSNGHVRGYVQQPHVHLPANAQGKLDVGGGVGVGMLYVMRDMGLRDVYRGSVELQSGEIADDFTYYFMASEQIPSAVGAGVLVDTDNSVIVSGGFIAQLLPGHDEADVEALEAALRRMPSVTDFLRVGRTVDELVEHLIPGVNILERQPLEFQCTCNDGRMTAMLKSLGRAELESMVEEQGGAEVVCHFCSTAYQFSADQLRQLMDS